MRIGGPTLARAWKLLAVVALSFGIGVMAGRGAHPKLWFGIRPGMDPSILQQTRRSAQLRGAVYFFGDSQVEGFATANLGADAANFGIAGDNTAELAARLPAYHFEGARLVVIESGVNDWGRDRFADFPLVYRHMLAAIPPRLPVIALAIAPPARTWAYKPRPSLAAIAGANAAIRHLCAARPGCRFVEPPLAGADGYLAPAYAERDGLHLSRAGYAIWTAALKPLVRQPLVQ